MCQPFSFIMEHVPDFIPAVGQAFELPSVLDLHLLTLKTFLMAITSAWRASELCAPPHCITYHSGKVVQGLFFLPTMVSTFHINQVLTLLKNPPSEVQRAVQVLDVNKLLLPYAVELYNSRPK